MYDIMIIIRKRMRIKMDIKRIDSYEDERFRKKVLKQHGAFEVDDLLYEVEIISDYEAVVRGFLADGGNWVQKFVHEALLRGIHTPYDMQVLSHSEYDLKWNKFCDELFEVK